MAMVQPEMLVADWTRIPTLCVPDLPHTTHLRATQMCHTTGPATLAVSPEPHCATSTFHYVLHNLQSTNKSMSFAQMQRTAQKYATNTTHCHAKIRHDDTAV